MEALCNTVLEGACIMGKVGVIAIDGPAGAGKSTVARLLAQRLGVNYMDTGALYRALAYWLDKLGMIPDENPEIERILDSLSVRLEGSSVFVNDQDVTQLIRSPRVDQIASSWSALALVRERLLDLQREQALQGPLVADGRDIGTVVFPLAPLKIFLTASAEERSARRWREMKDRGQHISLDELTKGMLQRDQRDSQRAVAPLRPAPDAVTVDSTNKDVSEIVTCIMNLVEERAHG